MPVGRSADDVDLVLGEDLADGREEGGMVVGDDRGDAVALMALRQGARPSDG